MWTFRLQRHNRVLKADANRTIVASAQKLTDLQSTEQQNHTHDEQLSHSTVSMNTGKCDAFISLGACVFLACIPNTFVYDTHTLVHLGSSCVFGAWCMAMYFEKYIAMYGDPGRAEEALERTLRTPRMRRLGALGS
jgi:hypothetical protein